MSMSGSPRLFRKAPSDPLMTISAATSHNRTAGKKKRNVLRKKKRTFLRKKKRKSILYDHHDRIFDQQLERPDQLGAERAVDRALVAGQRHAHDLRHFDLAVLDDRSLLAGADRQDGRVRRVDHGGKNLVFPQSEVWNNPGAGPI